jgi:hypothetical protein
MTATRHRSRPLRSLPITPSTSLSTTAVDPRSPYMPGQTKIEGSPGVAMKMASLPGI